MPRAQRKDEHIYFSMLNAPRRADFSDISLINNCLPNTSYSQISLETVYMGRTFRSPLLVGCTLPWILPGLSRLVQMRLVWRDSLFITC